MWLDSSTMIHTIHTTSTTMIAAANVENKVSITEQLGYRTPQQNSEDEDEAMDEGDENHNRSHPMSGPSKTPAEILRYQDPLGGMQSGLHAAAANGHREVAWLLLLLASDLSQAEFPPLVFQEAAAMGIMREDQDGLADIRSLKDAAGRSAEDVAAQEGGVVWNGWIGNGRLTVA